MLPVIWCYAPSLIISKCEVTMIIHLYLTLKRNFNKYIFWECDDFLTSHQLRPCETQVCGSIFVHVKLHRKRSFKSDLFPDNDY